MDVRDEWVCGPICRTAGKPGKAQASHSVTAATILPFPVYRFHHGGRCHPAILPEPAFQEQSMAHHNPGFLAIVDEARARIQETDVSTIRERLDRGDDFHLVDVREESEFAAGHLPGAMHIGRGVIERDIETKIPGHDDEIVLYCGGGFRSALAADNLQKMGYTNVLSMDGGFRAWREGGNAIEGAN